MTPDWSVVAADLAVVRDERADWRHRRNAHARLRAKAIDMAAALTDQATLFGATT